MATPVPHGAGAGGRADGNGNDPKLRVADVMAEYGIATERAAKKVMNDAVAFAVAGKLMVRHSDLRALEDRLIAARRPSAQAPSRNAGRSRPKPAPPAPRFPAGEPLPRDWYARSSAQTAAGKSETGCNPR